MDKQGQLKYLKSVGHITGDTPNLQEEKQLAREMLEHNNDALGSIPQDVRSKVNAEFIRLKTKHPDWKMDRLMKNAGKKHGIKFTFE